MLPNPCPPKDSSFFIWALERRTALRGVPSPATSCTIGQVRHLARLFRVDRNGLSRAGHMHPGCSHASLPESPLTLLDPPPDPRLLSPSCSPAGPVGQPCPIHHSFNPLPLLRALQQSLPVRNTLLHLSLSQFRGPRLQEAPRDCLGCAHCPMGLPAPGLPPRALSPMAWSPSAHGFPLSAS